MLRVTTRTVSTSSPRSGDELLARMLEYARYRSAAQWMHQRSMRERLPLSPGAAPARAQARNGRACVRCYDPQRSRRHRALLRTPPRLDTDHVARRACRSASAVAPAHAARRGSLQLRRRGRRRDRLTEAVTLLALLELYKQGRLHGNRSAFGPSPSRSRTRWPIPARRRAASSPPRSRRLRRLESEHE